MSTENNQAGENGGFMGTLKSKPWLVVIIVIAVIALVGGIVFATSNTDQEPTESDDAMEKETDPTRPTRSPTISINPDPSTSPSGTLTPEPTLGESSMRIRGEYYNIAKLDFGHHELKTTVTNITTDTIYEITQGPRWELTELEPGDYSIETTYPSGYSDAATQCQGGDCTSSGACSAAFKLEEGQDITLRCGVMKTGSTGSEIADSDTTPDVEIAYPSNGQTINSADTKVCVVDNPLAHAANLSRRMQVNGGGPQGFGNISPCFDAVVGENTVEIHHKNGGGFESEVTYLKFSFTQTQ